VAVGTLADRFFFSTKLWMRLPWSNWLAARARPRKIMLDGTLDVNPNSNPGLTDVR
jgi:hypothetical protein